MGTSPPPGQTSPPHVTLAPSDRRECPGRPRRDVRTRRPLHTPGSSPPGRDRQQPCRRTPRRHPPSTPRTPPRHRPDLTPRLRHHDVTPRTKDTLCAYQVATQSICTPPRQTAHPQARNLQDPLSHPERHHQHQETATTTEKPPAQNTHSAHKKRPTTRSRALSAIDPWWNPPWPLAWQRAYHHARKQCGSHQPLVPGDGFAGMGASAASWLYAQCALFEELHPRQQDLLQEIGITAEGTQARQTARYRPTGARIDFAVGLAHARDYAGVHDHLALPHPIQHHGFPLGRWLTGKRGEAGAHARRTPAPWPGMQALVALDPWWFPPWAFAWQRDYHRLRLLLAAGLEPPPKLRSWISEQLAQRHTLLPGQQRLLQELRIFPV
ncbi:hypothetical protein SSIG_07842 [Streptomyces filamentosus NRRL 11379]|nr:hypothetical protein SSIG_07842 [Streptomyces filamentosus NRRL 11379]